MLYHFIYPLSGQYSLFNIFRYITFRSLIGFLLASFIGILIGKKFINFMKMRQFGQIIRNDGPESHFKKAGTPTMGGFMIFFALFVSLAVVGNFGSLPLLGVIAITFSYFVLGFMDDYLKVLKKNTKGVSGKAKLVWQFATAIIVSYIFIKQGVVDTKLYIPFVKGPVIDLGHFYVFFMALVIVGSSNAVNLTDGLDGLAVGPVITSAISLGLLSYVAGHREIANYLLIPYVESVGELTVFAAVLIGAAIGFLWFNSYPAQIFMGDVGSLAMGGALGTMAVLTKNEVLYILIGGIFVIEALSVIIQVASYKLRKKRIFKMAPIHHHFELSGWPEPKVIVRFWIISAFLAIVSIATLKLR